MDPAIQSVLAALIPILMFVLGVVGFVWNFRNGLHGLVLGELKESREEQKDRWDQMQILYDRTKEENEKLSGKLAECEAVRQSEPNCLVCIFNVRNEGKPEA